jgi:hypothetical protein
VSFALPVYLLYFKNTKGNIIDNLHPGVIKQSVQIALCVDLFFTYALFLFPMSEALENDIRRLRSSDSPNQPRLRSNSFLMSSPILGGHKQGVTKPAELPLGARYTIRSTLVILTALVSYFAADFSAVSALSGGFGNNMVGFILPPLFITAIKYKQNWWAESGVSAFSKWGEIAINFIIFIGGIALLVTSIQAFIANL